MDKSHKVSGADGGVWSSSFPILNAVTNDLGLSFVKQWKEHSSRIAPLVQNYGGVNPSAIPPSIIYVWSSPWVISCPSIIQPYSPCGCLVVGAELHPSTNCTILAWTWILHNDRMKLPLLLHASKPSRKTEIIESIHGLIIWKRAAKRQTEILIWGSLSTPSHTRLLLPSLTMQLRKADKRIDL